MKIVESTLTFLVILQVTEAFVGRLGPRPETRYGSKTRLGYVDDNSNPSDTLSFEYAHMIDAADLYIRQEYDIWRYKYGKAAEESRYRIFRHHFFEQRAWNERNGKNYELNEFGDMSHAEYLQSLDASVLQPKETYDHDLLVLEPPMQGRYLDPVPVHENQYLVAISRITQSGETMVAESETQPCELNVDFFKKVGPKWLQSLKRSIVEYLSGNL